MSPEDDLISSSERQMAQLDIAALPDKVLNELSVCADSSRRRFVIINGGWVKGRHASPRE